MVVQGTGSNIKINPVTGLCMHHNNPKGLKCTNMLCMNLSHADNHNLAHCYWPSGGMESKAPAWIHNKSQKPETAAIVMATPSDPSSPCELSCATITELPDNDITVQSSTSPFISTLLDSETTSHLVTGHEYFLNFRMEDNPSMQMVNHSMLCTTSRGTCIAKLVLGGKKYWITLHECLHAPGALVNLLSVGRMLEKSWDCEFKGSHGGSASHCQLSYNGEVLGSLPLVGNLCHIDLQFIHPSKLVSYTLRVKEISAVVKPVAMLDLWHAWMGHLGGDLVKRLPLITMGMNINHSTPLLQYEACIMAKHT